MQKHRSLHYVLSQQKVVQFFHNCFKLTMGINVIFKDTTPETSWIDMKTNILKFNPTPALLAMFCLTKWLIQQIKRGGAIIYLTPSVQLYFMYRTCTCMSSKSLQHQTKSLEFQQRCYSYYRLIFVFRIVVSKT